MKIVRGSQGLGTIFKEQYKNYYFGIKIESSR